MISTQFHVAATLRLPEMTKKKSCETHCLDLHFKWKPSATTRRQLHIHRVVAQTRIKAEKVYLHCRQFILHLVRLNQGAEALEDFEGFGKKLPCLYCISLFFG